MSSLRPILLALMLVVACDSATRRGSGNSPPGGRPGAMTGDAGTTRSDAGFPATGPDTDILFVVDNSASMAITQRRLAEAATDLIDVLHGRVAYRIGVVTTDVTSGGGVNGMEASGVRVSNFKSVEPFTLTNIDESACMTVPVAHGCFRGQTPVVTSDMDKASAISELQDNLLVGTCGSGTESGLAALRLALENTEVGRCNEGFLRPDARLLIMFVSDEDDQESRNPVPVRAHADALVEKPAELVRVASIIGYRDGRPQNCGAQGACGGQCMRRPPEGSGITGCQTTPSACPNQEFCDGARDTCTNLDLQNFEPFCHWCSFYAAPDCCAALAGERYVEFSRVMEDKVASATTALADMDCAPTGGAAAACDVASICQDELSTSLVRFVQNLIFDGM